MSQYLDLESGNALDTLKGDIKHINWSIDGNKIAFQNSVGTKNNLVVYDLYSDTLMVFKDDSFNFQHPVWHPTENDLIVFDENTEEKHIIKTHNSQTGEIDQLFNRDIDSYWPSFTKSGRLVFFTGYNETEKKWEIYSYDFIYDNLNEVSDIKFDCKNPVVSADGKLILFQKNDPFHSDTELLLMNWYGENVTKLVDEHCHDYSWDPAGLKLYFTTEDKNGVIQLFSIWKNGTHKEQLTDSKYDISSPAVSPDGSLMALVIKSEFGDFIIIIPFDDY